MKSRLIPALLLGIATATLGPVACNMAGDDTAAEVTPGHRARHHARLDGHFGEAGRRLLQLRQRRVDEGRPRSRPTARTSAGSGSPTSRPRRTSRRCSPTSSSPSRRPAATRRGSRPTTTPSSTPRRSTGSAWRRSRATCSASPRSRTRPASPARSVPACAPTSIRSTPPTSTTENLFGVFVTQALADEEVMPYILQGGLGMPEREYYLSGEPEMAGTRPRTASISPTCSPPPASTMRAERASASRTSSSRSPAPTPPARKATTGRRPRQIWTADRVRHEGPGPRLGRRSSMPRSSAARRSSTPITPAPFPSSPRWSAPSRSRRGRTG